MLEMLCTKTTKTEKTKAPEEDSEILNEYTSSNAKVRKLSAGLCVCVFNNKANWSASAFPKEPNQIGHACISCKQMIRSHNT